MKLSSSADADLHSITSDTYPFGLGAKKDLSIAFLGKRPAGKPARIPHKPPRGPLICPAARWAAFPAVKCKPSGQARWCRSASVERSARSQQATGASFRKPAARDPIRTDSATLALEHVRPGQPPHHIGQRRALHLVRCPLRRLFPRPGPFHEIDPFRQANGQIAARHHPLPRRLPVLTPTVTFMPGPSATSRPSTLMAKDSSRMRAGYWICPVFSWITPSPEMDCTSPGISSG